MHSEWRDIHPIAPRAGECPQDTLRRHWDPIAHYRPHSEGDTQNMGFTDCFNSLKRHILRSSRPKWYSCFYLPPQGCSAFRASCLPLWLRNIPLSLFPSHKSVHPKSRPFFKPVAAGSARSPEAVPDDVFCKELCNEPTSLQPGGTIMTQTDRHSYLYCTHFTPIALISRDTTWFLCNPMPSLCLSLIATQ